MNSGGGSAAVKYQTRLVLREDAISFIQNMRQFADSGRIDVWSHPEDSNLAFVRARPDTFSQFVFAVDFTQLERIK